ncbi:MAG TPA: STAS domain-containing protein [Gemmatimonadales bacterium]|nr:STAS domain-containing protein [Gemmatimonadales bacterium]
MSATQVSARVIVAPEVLGLDTRVEFRSAVTRELDGLPDGAVLTLDLAGTRRVDSAGLSALMLIQRHASDRAQRIVLRDPSEEMRFLLALTLMTDLFELEPRQA